MSASSNIFASNVWYSGNVNVAQTLNVSGNVAVTQTLNTATLNVTSIANVATMNVSGNVNVAQTLNVATLNVTSAASIVGFAASQWTTLNSNIYYLSNVSIGATTVDSKYKLIVTGNVAVTKDVFTFYSDERLKTKIGPLENALDKVCSLEGFTYVPNEFAKQIGAVTEDDQTPRVGLSAQSVQRVLPEAVGPAPFNDQYLTVQYEKIVPLLVEAIKELRREVGK